MTLVAGVRRGLYVPRDYARPMVPAAVADAVEAWARTWGRTVRWQWVDHPGMHCWALHLSPMAGDPKLRAVQEGRWSAEDAEEHVLLVNSAEPLDLEQYGAVGVVEWLERGNMRSGRGEANSLAEQIRRNREGRRERAAKAKQGRAAWARDLAREVRRQVLRIPLVRAGIDLRRGS